MSRPLPSSLIAVSFSTRKTMMPVTMVEQSAAAAGVDGLDIDATSSVSAWLAGRLGNLDANSIPVRSVWIPAEEIDFPRSQRILQALIDRQLVPSPLVVAMLPNVTTPRDLARAFDPRCLVSQRWPVALGLPSAALRGGRPHLVQLGVIRRFAEEWDFSVAVDLSGNFDPTWEAEAAIARLGDRLGILRITAAAPSRGAVGRDRVACRALHAAIDRDRKLEIAVTPVKSVPFPITPRVASLGVRRAMDYITERAAVHAQALREGIGRFEGSPTSHGN